MAYTKQPWANGDIITATKMNHIEDGIEAISANGAINTANLADGAVTTAKLAANAVTSAKIANNSITEDELADGAVVTSKIEDGAVTRAKIADAALADIAAEYSSSSTYAVGDYVFHSGALYRCVTDITTAESWTAAHWTAAVLGDDVADLKSAFDSVTESDVIVGNNLLNLDTMSIGYMWNNTLYPSATNYKHSDYIPVTAGETYSFQTQTNSNLSSRAVRTIRFVCEYGADKTYIRSKENVGASNNPYTIPSDVSYIIASFESAYFTDTSTTKPAFVKGTTIIPYEPYVAPTTVTKLKAVLYEESQSLSDAEKTLARSNIGAASQSELSSFLPTIIRRKAVSMTWTDGAYMNASGTPVSNASYAYSNQIPVNSGDTLIGRIRMLTVYKDASTTIYGQFKENINSYVVPDGVQYVVVSTETANKDTALAIQYSEKASIVNEPQMMSLETERNGMDAIIATGTIDSTHNVKIKGYYTRKGFSLLFTGDITSFDTLEIGAEGFKDSSKINSSGIEIDDTNVVFYRAGQVDGTAAHGLTISGYIAVSIEIDAITGKPTVTICTENGNFQNTFSNVWLGGRLYFIAKTTASVLSGCTLAFYCDDIKKPIWYIGDSYMSQGDHARLPYWLQQYNVYKNICSIGYSGGAVAGVMNTLNMLFEKHLCPHYIVWAIGMNNGDSSSEINAIWETETDALVDFCESNNIELILCTTPNTPTVNNTYKNAYVRESNLPYVDYASAVNTSESGTEWISGTLSNDNVHPTEEGAKRLAARLLIDFPEIAN